MHIISLDTQSQQELENLVSRCEFLQLKNSREVYPDAPGSGLPLLLVETSLCSATIALQGAQLLEFKPADGDALLWLSPNCDFTPGVALRGGIPLCLPWFGVNPQDPSKPKHGFARNNPWQLANAQARADGTVELEFLFVSDANPLFAYDFSAELRMLLGKTIHLELTINNTDELAFDCSWVMHTYFAVTKLDEVRVPELAGHQYKDNLEAYALKNQQQPLDFAVPLDRVFTDVGSSLEIHGSTRLRITHNNCPSVVTWNPGAEAAQNIADIGAGQEAFFVCVERGAVHEERWSIAPGSSQSAWMEIAQID